MICLYACTSLFPSPEFLDEQSLTQTIRTLLRLLIPVPNHPPSTLFHFAQWFMAQGCVWSIFSPHKSYRRCCERNEACRPLHAARPHFKFGLNLPSTHLDIPTRLEALEAHGQRENTTSRTTSSPLQLLFKICDNCLILVVTGNSDLSLHLEDLSLVWCVWCPGLRESLCDLPQLHCSSVVVRHDLRCRIHSCKVFIDSNVLSFIQHFLGTGYEPKNPSRSKDTKPRGLYKEKDF